MLPVVPNGIPPSVYAETSSRSSTRVKSASKATSITCLAFSLRKSPGPREHPRPALAVHSADASHRAFPAPACAAGPGGAVPGSSSEARLWKSQQRSLPVQSGGARWGCIQGGRGTAPRLPVYHRRGEGIQDDGSSLRDHASLQRQRRSWTGMMPKGMGVGTATQTEVYLRPTAKREG
ncbi:hypothetical protein FIBSPDRAFT_551906 [Athelia psychrophila]|uniref:Uncharacterized protein n=1 Tax=Athelia psychrophila TaxID=1759441 RepID=A0A166UVL1_9AGAM|nr:hypothetical protein FIBSPDRAFT_551906 [Fibularhizoctonia sp. CBS 109695]